MARRHIPDSSTNILMRLDESSGSPINHGRYNGMTVTPTDASPVAVSDMHFNYARSFNGSTSKIALSMDTASRSDRTNVSLWFKPTSWPSINDGWMYCRGTEVILAVTTTQKLRAEIVDSGGTPYYVEYDISSLLGTWIYATLDYDGEKLTLFMNGAIVNSDDSMSNILRKTATGYYIGNDATNTYAFTGQIVELVVHACNCIQSVHYGAYNENADPTIAFEVEDDSIAVYNCDDDFGTTFVDDTGNHNGTIYGSPTFIDSPVGAKSAAKGYYFNADSSKYISIPHHVDFDIGSGKDLTIEVWGRNITAGSSYKAIASKYPTTAVNYYAGWHFAMATNSEASIGGTSARNVYRAGNYPQYAGCVFYTAASISFSRRAAFVYGSGHPQSRGDSTLTTFFPWSQAANTDPLIIGRTMINSPTYYDPWDGHIYALRFTRRAKGLQEIIAYHTSSNPRLN